MRPVGVASGLGLKHICEGFEKGDGIRSNYHIRADPELIEKGNRPGVIAMRRFPCFCKPCLDKMKEPIESRYTGTNNNCEYRDIFNKSDGTSYNDWKLIKLSPKPKQYREEDDLAQLEVTVRGIGIRMAGQMYVGGFGAYITDDERYDYYIFKCTVAPKQSDGN